MKTVREKTIQSQILEKLRERLADLPENSLFQTERELCDEFGVTRTTMTRVMVKLVAEGLLHRIPFKGSLVRKIRKNSPAITFLLPCADFLSEKFSFQSAETTRLVLSGVSKIAFEHNCRVETVPVSPTNNADEIDWNKLDFINADSQLVIAGSYWYSKLFPFLKERGCKVAFVENQTHGFIDYADYLKEWFLLIMDRISAIKLAVKLLADSGCRKIALAHGTIKDKDHPVLRGYESGLAECGLSYAAWLDTQDTNDSTIRDCIANFYKKNKFDALLLDPYLVFKLRTQYSLNRSLALPETVKIIATDEICYNQQALPSLSSVEFPYEKMGQIAAQRLLENDFVKGRQIFNARIIERESTAYKTESPYFINKKKEDER